MKAEVFADTGDLFLVVDETFYVHLGTALRASERVNKVKLLNTACPLF